MQMMFIWQFLGSVGLNWVDQMLRIVESGDKMMINWFRGQRQKDIRRRLIQGKVPSSQVEAAKKKKK